MIILGIESSCDETAVGIVRNGDELLANVVASSMNVHARYGGVIPELAARSHIEVIIPVLEQALKDAACTWDDIDGIAVTYGAGLLGSLLIGVLTARTLAVIKRKPLFAINHVEAHLYANFITESAVSTILSRKSQPEFPILGIIVSGGHSQLVLFNDHFNYTLLGQTQDDAIGEAYDKVAKMLGLPYPGGLNVSRLAEKGDSTKYRFPKARLQYKYDFSFSGLKTAVLRLAQQEVGKDYRLSSQELPGLLNDKQKADIAASFASTACETIVDKALAAYQEFQPRSVIVGGGVAADKELRQQLSSRLPVAIEYPDLALCGDNGAMVATLGCFKAMRQAETANPYVLEASPTLSM
ncbi:MAG TPA: tRNA (adenosine(37)-N6)-threonylcarbamoyltransferase complex transferase subunit TsaD [Candidatus Saccharimonadales bacterium]|nr:tRNA (adenosine(37)-N6)-threonylcarbamoyltransferase complex transferase subunit TsaD [Candidatus Saccharimonadales bacterium]